MDTSKESEQKTRVRLRSVLKAAEVHWFPGDYAFTETSDPSVAALAVQKSIAIVRDRDTWSVLAEATRDSRERFRIFACHFDSELPNSGFIGWLASEIKRQVGSGVFVVCGQNRKRGGIFDYCGREPHRRLCSWGSAESRGRQRRRSRVARGECRRRLQRMHWH